MSEQTYLKILRWGIYLTLLTPLLIFKSLLFPFITSKTFYFRIIVEILFVVYILFLYQYPKYLPRKKTLSIVLIIFVFILVLTSITGVDFNLSFWSDVERMEGAFGFLHLTLYFFILVSVFRTKEDWKRLLGAFLASTTLLCIYGWGQKLGFKGLILANEARISSTLGNPAYLGAIVLFGIAVSLIFSLQENWGKKILYFAIAAGHAIILLYTGTRGAFLGLISAILFAFVLYAVLHKNKRLRISLVVIILCAVTSLIYIIKSKSAFAERIRRISYVSRFTDISFADATWNTRLISWKAGMKGLRERPLLGVGSGNYAYFFDKYFDPSFYTFTAQQTYFDHAHNTIVDIVVTTGIVGLFVYLAIWAVLIYYLILNFRQKKISLNEFVILFSLLVAYFVQNIFVFDCLATFIAFFIFCAYISYPQYAASESHGKTRKFNSFIAVAASIFSLILIFKFNLLPAKAMVESVKAQSKLLKEGDIKEGYEEFKKSLNHETVLDRDIRSSFINLLLSNGYGFSQAIKNEELLDMVNFAIEKGEKNIKFNSEDTLMNLQMGELLDLKARLTRNTADLAKGEEYLLQALKSSPGRLQIHFKLAENKLLGGKNKEAIQILESARNMNPNYSECYINLSRAYLIEKNEEKAYNTMEKAMELGYDGLSKEQVDTMIKYFTTIKDYDTLVKIYEKSISRDSQNADLMAKLAAIYAKLGKNKEAELMVRKAVSLNPNFKIQAEKFLEKLKEGQLKEVIEEEVSK